MHDADLREYKREMTLNALAERYAPSPRSQKSNASISVKGLKRKPVHEKPLFSPLGPNITSRADDSDDDLDLSIAMSESLEAAEDAEVQRAIVESRRTVPLTPPARLEYPSRPSASRLSPLRRRISPERDPLPLDDDEDDGLYIPQSRLDNVLALANTGMTTTHTSTNVSPSRIPLDLSTLSTSGSFGRPSLLMSLSEPEPAHVSLSTGSLDSDDDDMEEVDVMERPTSFHSAQPLHVEEAVPQSRISKPRTPSPDRSLASTPSADYLYDMPDVESGDGGPNPESRQQKAHSLPSFFTSRPMLELPPVPIQSHSSLSPPRLSPKPASSNSPLQALEDLSDVSSSRRSPGPSSRSPSPRHQISGRAESASADTQRPLSPAASTSLFPDRTHDEDPTTAVDVEEDWDAAQEMDPHAEEDEFARFVSEVKGRDLETVREEVDREINSLNQERKIAMRDSEDITQQMIAQIMVPTNLSGYLMLPELTTIYPTRRCSGFSVSRTLLLQWKPRHNVLSW